MWSSHLPRLDFNLNNKENFEFKAHFDTLRRTCRSGKHAHKIAGTSLFLRMADVVKGKKFLDRHGESFRFTFFLIHSFDLKMKLKLKSLRNTVNILPCNDNIMSASSFKGGKRPTGINLTHSLEHLVRHHYKVSKIPHACWIEGIPLIILVIEKLVSLLEVYLFCSL